MKNNFEIESLSLEDCPFFSGLAAAIIIVETPKKSSILAIADFAKKQGKPVFTVPGSVSSKNFQGSR